MKYYFVETTESEDKLEAFYNKVLDSFFAGKGLVNETEMYTNFYQIVIS
jgi:hypothetical protein